MSWLKKIRRSGKGEQERVQFPIHFELIPGELSAQVYLHEVASRDGPVTCWSYVSDGLWAHRQKELIFTLGLGRGQGASEFPDDPLKFFAGIYPYAKGGQVVDAGDFTELGSPIMLGHKSIVYANPEVFDDFSVLAPSLAAVLLKDEELEAVKAFGFTRVLARLAQAYGHYPYPTWFDPTRGSLLFEETMQKSVLSQVNRIRVRGARVSVSREKNQIELRITRKAGQFLQEQLSQFSPDTVIALLTELDHRANACLVWEPGQTQPAAVTPPNSDGSRLAGCFIGFVPRQSEDGGQLVEDGFMMMLTDSSWTRIRESWAIGEAVSVQGQGERMGFSINWLRESYHNPVDGLDYYSEGGWESYEPVEPQKKETGGATDLKEIVLLSGQSEVEGRVDVGKLTTYTKAMEAAVEGYFSEQEASAGQDFLVQIELSPEGLSDLKMASKPGIPDEILQGLYDKLLDIPVPAVTEGAIKFQIVFSIWGGSGK